jgi:hypothetical protein
MIAFHSLWTKPNNNGLKTGDFMEDYELLAMILSALKWQEKNGSIMMITDSKGKDFLIENGLKELWDLGIKENLDDLNDSFIDPFLFWAAGKLYSLKLMQCPCVMIDTDLIVWESLTHRFKEKVIVAHYEELGEDVYPKLEMFHFKNDYKIPDRWDRNIKACNTAFLYMPTAQFRDYYVQSAMDFMKCVITDKLNPINAMCTAEQRILPMCAQEKGMKMDCLINLDQAQDQQIATHIWGYKRILKYSYAEREQFCMSCIRRIIRDFPVHEKLITENRLFQYYCERL